MELQGEASRVADVRSGVPQGSVLGLLLFLMFVNDLANRLNKPSYLLADDMKIVGNPRQGHMQEDLDKLFRWTEIWNLPLNLVKCKQLTKNGEDFPKRLLGPSGNGVELERVEAIRDLGVQMTADFKPSVQYLAAAKKANVALYQLRRTMRSREPRVLVPLFKAFVRPHLEYAVQAWAPLLKQDETTLEAPQRRFTRWFSAIRAKPYTERLQELGLFSLERRRKREDLIQTYKLIRGVNDVDWRLIFKAAKDHGLRGHPWKIEKPTS